MQVTYSWNWCQPSGTENVLCKDIGKQRVQEYPPFRKLEVQHLFMRHEEPRWKIWSYVIYLTEICSLTRGPESHLLYDALNLPLIRNKHKGWEFAPKAALKCSGRIKWHISLFLNLLQMWPAAKRTVLVSRTLIHTSNWDLVLNKKFFQLHALLPDSKDWEFTWLQRWDLKVRLCEGVSYLQFSLYRLDPTWNKSLTDRWVFAANLSWLVNRDHVKTFGSPSIYRIFILSFWVTLFLI